jgi:hypothetical protein
MKAECLLLIVGCLSLSNCSTDNTQKQLGSSVAPTAPLLAAASSSPEKTVREYVAWYVKYHAELPANFIKNVDGTDTTHYYAVDFQVTESWLTAVRRSGLLADTYLQKWRQHFEQYADTLRRQRQNDGPPSGFEYDFLLLSQEPDTKIAELRAGSYVTTSVSPARAKVVVLGPQHEGWREGLRFELSKSATNKWLIDAISIPDNLTQ